MRQLLVEGVKGAYTFFPDKKVPASLVQETLPNGRPGWIIPGRLSECDKVNGNGRRYGRKVWEANTSEGSALRQKIANFEAFGKLEHPKDGQIDLESAISHTVINVKLDENGIVTGEIAIIDYGDNSPGRKLKAMIETGYNPRVSSRGFGSLVKGPDGVDEVQTDYVCEGWDVVIKPSFENAILQPDRTALDTVLARPAESAQAPKPAVSAVIENTLKPEAKDTPPASAASAAPAAVAAVAPTKTQVTESTSMNINEVKARIAQLRSVDASKLSPTRFAESVAAMSSLHEAISAWVAEDAKRNYEGDKLHRQLEQYESNWANAQNAPTKNAIKLREDRNKVLHVCKNLVETALKWKNATAETLKTNASQRALIEEITTNGQGWMALANKRKVRTEFMERKYKLACECISVLTGRYNEDLATIGAHALTLEFKDKITPEVQTALNEAVTAKNPKAVLAIREQLEGKTPGTAPATATAPSTTATGAPAQVRESKTAPAAAPVTENKPAAPATATIISEAMSDPRSCANAVSIVERLSASVK